MKIGAGQGAIRSENIGRVKRSPAGEVVSLIGGNPKGTEESRPNTASTLGHDLPKARSGRCVILATRRSAPQNRAKRVDARRQECVG